MAEIRRILVTGGNGQLGMELADGLASGRTVEAVGSDTLDITDAEAVPGFFGQFRPDVVLHAAAWTDVDGCEQDQNRAMRVNAEGTKHVAEACRRVGAWMIYFSTDYVFDGAKDTAYCEDDRPFPMNVYGRSKLYGEGWVRDIAERYTILRLAWLYGFGGDNFVSTMLAQGAEQVAARSRGIKAPPLRVVDDQLGNPTWTADVVRQTETVLARGLTGLYHASSERSCSWYEFALEVFREMDMPVEVWPCTSELLEDRAPRPRNSAMDNCALMDAGANVMRDWRTALSEYLRLYGERLLR